MANPLDAHVVNLKAMNRCRRSSRCLLAGGLSLLALDSPAIAADVRLPAKAPHIQSVLDWTGFYIGAHAGFGRGASSAVLTDPAITASSDGYYYDGYRRCGWVRQFDAFGNYIGRVRTCNY